MEFKTRSISGEFDLSDPVRSFVNTLRRMIFSPRDFFRGMPRRGGVLNPLIFAVVCTLIGALLSGVFQEVAPVLPGMMQIFSVNAGFISSVIYRFVGTMIGLVVITGVYHLLFRLIAGRYNGGLEATFRVLCYLQWVQLVAWLPLVNVLAFLYAVYLGVLGFAEVHTTTYGRAAFVVLLPMLLYRLWRTVLFIFATVLLSAALFFSG